MTLQGEAASLTDRYRLAIGLPLATTTSPKKQIQYWYSHGIVEKTFPITQMREAHEAKEKRLIQGKVVLDLDEFKPTVHELLLYVNLCFYNWRALMVI
ncbi:Hypothetical predicted protein [Olea europaea subsp. europaea]|uniref:Uncharacterized protein n=1 Tax=Olea europaea subsp. europaea TaxID=158383 RepID=A0A8S0RF97_OLEEU|nr:Hypothetical predicted protein [Olea europaea subsp. europaea]